MCGWSVHEPPQRFPPPMEIDETDGSYVLDDAGPTEYWRYVFVPRRA